MRLLFESHWRVLVARLVVAVSLSIGLLAGASGCSERDCAPGTLLLEFVLPATIASAESIDLVAKYGGAELKATVTQPLMGKGTVEIRFPAGNLYKENQTLQLVANAKSNGMTIATFNGEFKLSKTCFAKRVELVAATIDNDLGAADLKFVTDGPAVTEDLSLADLATGVDEAAAFDQAEVDQTVLLDLAPVQDLTPLPDLTPVCTNGTIRCKPDDHRKQQTCVAGQWSEEFTCVAPGGVSTPPVYACTEAKQRCIDTAWPQWNLKNAPPSPRFVTVPSTGTPGEDMIFDKLTGLTWQLKGTTTATFTWMNAQSQCTGLSYGGFSGDWRAPSRAELNTIVDRQVGAAPYVKSVFAADTASEVYWTSSPRLGLPGAWVTTFLNGSLTGSEQTAYRVRCVR